MDENKEDSVKTALQTPSADEWHSASLEAVYRALGQPGRFAIIQIVLYYVSFASVAFPILNVVFIGYETPHTCAKLSNETDLIYRHGFENDSSASLQYNECSINLVTNQSGRIETVHSFSCLNGNDYDGQRHISFVSEWNLVCERKTGLSELVQTVLMIGLFFGSLITTNLADRIGRKVVVLVSQLILISSGIAAAYAPNIYVLICLRFLIGFSQQGVVLVGWTLVLEGIVPEYRRYVGTAMCNSWNLTIALVALCAWLMKDMSWRHFQLVSGLVTLNVVFNIFFLFESPRWLLANGKYHEILTVFKRASQFNGKDVNTIKSIFIDKVTEFEGPHIFNLTGSSEKSKEKSTLTANETNKKDTVFDIFRHKFLRQQSLIVFVLWITCSMTYYGLYLTSSSLSGNRHLNFFLLGVVDFLGDLIIFLFIDRLGRRVLCFISLCITGSGLLTSSLLMAFGSSALSKTLTTVFFIVGKFGIGLCFNIIYIYTPELYPTNIRSGGLGLCSSMARIGGMAAPYSGFLVEIAMWGPGALFTGMCILCGSLLFMLPETKGRSLPATIEEMKQWNKERGVKTKTVSFSEPEVQGLMKTDAEDN